MPTFPFYSTSFSVAYQGLLPVSLCVCLTQAGCHVEIPPSLGRSRLALLQEEKRGTLSGAQVQEGIARKRTLGRDWRRGPYIFCATPCMGALQNANLKELCGRLKLTFPYDPFQEEKKDLVLPTLL